MYIKESQERRLRSRKLFLMEELRMHFKVLCFLLIFLCTGNLAKIVVDYNEVELPNKCFEYENLEAGEL